jgi:hypothetical protein
MSKDDFDDEILGFILKQNLYMSSDEEENWWVKSAKCQFVVLNIQILVELNCYTLSILLQHVK